MKFKAVLIHKLTSPCYLSINITWPHWPAIEGVFDNHIADGALPFFASVGVGDLLYRADVKRVGNATIAAVGDGAAVAASVGPIFKFNF